MIVGHIGGGASGGVDTGDIPASLRHRRSGSCYSQRTPTTAGNRLVWTYSVWFQSGSLGTQQWLLDAGTDGNNESAIVLEANDTLQIYNYVAASYGKWIITNAVRRDPSSFYHLVVSSNGTTWFKVYLNGVELTSFSTNTGTNGTNWFFNSSSHFMRAGARFNGTNYFDGQIARECFVANSALAASDFGYFNTETNEWVTKTAAQVKAVVDAGGANSSMRDFDDPNFATYNVGKDYSSKGNHWTPNNFSLTAGTSYDYMKSVPGNTYCIASEIDKGANPASTTLTEAGLKSACSAVTGGSSVCGTMGIPEGKFYFELTPTAIGNGIILGVTSRTSGAPSGSVVGYVFDGNKNIAGSASAYGATYANNDIIGVAVDTTANTIEFFKNNTSQGVITNSTYIVPECKPLHWNNSSSGSSTVQHNYGQAPLHASSTYHSAAGGYFRYAPPTGYKALCQANMPDPAILNPENHVETLLHTGNGTSQNVTGTKFQPDLAWIKSRNTNYWNFLYDSVRGATKALVSNSTNAEATYAAGLTGFLSNGISLGNQSDVNGSTYTYVDWLWKAGGAAVTNNAGTVSAQVSANVNAGFSIATFASPAAGDFSIGHGLSKAPGLVIAKATNGNTFNWAVFHVGVCTNGQFLRLNTTDAKQTPGGNVWGAAIPSATLVNLTATGAVEASKNCVAYCFAEIPGFSKIFSYTGNGSADGPFVHCGFKPKFVLIKASSAAEQWGLIDSVRSVDNPSNEYLIANSANAEDTVYLVDILSNGFKPRVGAGFALNGSGTTYIGIAFADVPAKYSLAR